MSVKPYSFELGDYECLVIQDQTAVMPLGNLVANAEPEELEQVSLQLGLPAEGVAVGYNCLLVRTNRHERQHPGMGQRLARCQLLQRRTLQKPAGTGQWVG